ncbi:MAG: Gx transporter family protein [Eubacterium sp.]|nr:Gx transporter family protein [Eubacterium sp.]
MSNKSKKIALFGLMIALAFVFSYLDSLIPISIGIPGIKLGLANLVVVTAIYIFPKRDALIIAVIRIILSGLTFGGVSTMLFSLAGGLLSFLVMVLLQKTEKMSVIGVSVAGGIFHNVGQIIVAAFVMETARLVYYLPVLVISGVVTGLLIGIISDITVKRLKKSKFL